MERTIILEFYDFVYFRISGDRNLLLEVQKSFQWDSPNKYMVQQMANKYGAWDGKVKLFKLNDMLFPVGFFKRLKLICKNSDIKISMSKKAHSVIKNNKVELDSITNEIMSYFNDEFLDKIGGEIYRHQLEASIIAIKDKRGLFDIHTRGGKSVIIYVMLMWLYKHLEPDDKLVLIVPRIHLTEQMYEDFEEYTNDTTFLKWVSVFYGESENKDINKQVQVTTYQSFIKNTHVYSDVKAVIVDEVQGADSDQLQKILKGCNFAEYRWGTTGTIPRDDLSKWTIISLLGPILYRKDLLESVAEGIVTDFEINFVFADYMDEDRMYENAYSDFQNFIANISEYEERPHITDALIECGMIKNNDKIFQTFNRKNSLANFEAHNKDEKNKIFDNFSIYKFDGSVNMKKRKAVKELMKATPPDKGVITEGTLSVMNAGITIPNLNCVMFCDPSKKPETIQQAIGRALGLDRENPDKTATIIDVVDWVKYKRKEGYSLKHFKERLKYFKECGYKVKFHYFKWDAVRQKFIKKDLTKQIQNMIDKLI